MQAQRSVARSKEYFLQRWSNFLLSQRPVAASVKSLFCQRKSATSIPKEMEREIMVDGASENNIESRPFWGKQQAARAGLYWKIGTKFTLSLQQPPNCCFASLTTIETFALFLQNVSPFRTAAAGLLLTASLMDLLCCFQVVIGSPSSCTFKFWSEVQNSETQNRNASRDTFSWKKGPQKICLLKQDPLNN